MLVAVVGMALGFASCGEDDVKDFACDTARDALRAPVDVAIAAFREDETSQTCEAARNAIDSYKSNECGDSHFDAVLEGLPDCSTL